MITYETASHYIKLRELDHYEEGCLSDTAQTTFIEQIYKADSLEELLELLGRVCNAEKDAFLLNCCGDVGRVDIQTLETNSGRKPSQNQIEQWKQGKVNLYACTYTFYISKVEEVNFTKEFAALHGYTNIDEVES